MLHCNVMALATRSEAFLSIRGSIAGFYEVLVLIVVLMCSSGSEVRLKH